MKKESTSIITDKFILGPIFIQDTSDILQTAFVPEHSVDFMRAMSGGEPFMVHDYLFLAGEDWLMAIGYPLHGKFDAGSFEQALNQTLRRIRPARCWSVSPEPLPHLSDCVLESDHYYLLHSDVQIHPRLLRLAGKAAGFLRVEAGREFSSEHRLLWKEFAKRKELPERVSSMFSKSRHVVAGAHDLTLLNAWDEKGSLAACLLLDLAPRRFASYLIGAYSRRNYIPHATDLLFMEMLSMCRRLGKEFIHLGLGVNPGILRFKLKWGAERAWPYKLAAWKNKQGIRRTPDPAESLPFMEDKLKFFMNLPEQRKLTMLWELEKDGRISWIAGASHFSRFSFRLHLKRILHEVDTVLCEGPLDQVNMDLIAEVGKHPDQNAPRLASFLSSQEIRELEKTVCGFGFWSRFISRDSPAHGNVRNILNKTRHWYAFFALWSQFLRRQGWKQSVDLEAWNTSKEMGKFVLGMETIHEQLRTMESIPLERVVRFIKNCREWRSLSRHFERYYLKGELENMFGTSAEFPSRTEMVIDRRDELFLKRMIPFLNQGRCAVFVGTAHMLNLRGMLKKAGFRVRRSR